jgi:hypothetical protein
MLKRRNGAWRRGSAMRYRSWSREAFSLVTKMKPPLRAIAILVLSVGLVAVVLGTALAHTGPLPVIAGQ